MAMIFFTKPLIAAADFRCGDLDKQGIFLTIVASRADRRNRNGRPTPQFCLEINMPNPLQGRMR